MILQINPKEFVTSFINPINDLDHANEKVAIFTDEGELYSVSTTKARSINLYNTYKPLNIEEPLPRCSMNMRKLIKGLQCIDTEDQFISLEVSKEYCSFATKEIKFNIRLLEDHLVEVPKFPVDVFKKFTMHHTVNVDAKKVVNIKKALEFSDKTFKFYLEQEGTNVFFFFGDKASTSQHTDDIKILVAEDIETEIPKKIYDVDILKLILKAKNDFSMKLNNNGVMYIEIENSNANLKYITTPLLK